MRPNIFLQLTFWSLLFYHSPALAQTIEQWCSATVKRVSRYASSNYLELAKETNLFGITLDGIGKKRVRILKKSDWGAPKELKQKNISISVAVNDTKEAIAIFAQLTGETNWPENMNGHIVENKIWGSIQRADDRSSAVSDYTELKIDFTGDATPPDVSKIIDKLQTLGLHLLNPATESFNFNNPSQAREWAVFQSLEWSRGLSTEEKKSLASISSADFRSVHSSLRSNPTEAANQKTVTYADSAIGKSSAERDFKLNRAVNREDLNALWEKMYSSKRAPTMSITPDPGYLFGSIDFKVAKWWQSGELNGNGVILEINVPKGHPAAFIDGDGIQSNRGFLEFVLQRNLALKATEAKIIDGSKILVVEAK